VDLTSFTTTSLDYSKNQKLVKFLRGNIQEAKVMRITNQSKPSYFEIGFIITLMRRKTNFVVNAMVVCIFTVVLSCSNPVYT